MIKKNNVIIACLIFSFLHGTKQMPHSPIKHEGFAFSFPSLYAPQEQRDMIFQDDLLDLLVLNDSCKKHLKRLEEVNIVIKAVNDYHCPRGEKIQVKVQNNKWAIVIKNITEDILLECISIEELIPAQRSQNILEKYLSTATQWVTKMGIYIWGKTLAKYAKCTITIHVKSQPEDEHVLCSEVLIDLLDLAEQNKLHITRFANDILNTHIIVSEI